METRSGVFGGPQGMRACVGNVRAVMERFFRVNASLVAMKQGWQTVRLIVVVLTVAAAESRNEFK
jgi:hypothetical protein